MGAACCKEDSFSRETEPVQSSVHVQLSKVWVYLRALSGAENAKSSSRLHAAKMCFHRVDTPKFQSPSIFSEKLATIVTSSAGPGLAPLMCRTLYMSPALLLSRLGGPATRQSSALQLCGEEQTNRRGVVALPGMLLLASADAYGTPARGTYVSLLQDPPSCHVLAGIRCLQSNRALLTDVG